MNGWYTRPVVGVSDAGAAGRFYVRKLGFSEAWRYEEGGRAMVVQVERDGCELILSGHWPEAIGRGTIFISLDEPDLAALRRGYEAEGVELSEGFWGYRVMIVADPDGNRLLFPYPQEAAAQPE